MPVDYFLTVPHIAGEVTATTSPGSLNFAGSIRVFSFSWGQTNSGTASSGAGGAGKVSFSDFNVLKSFDRSSPLLMDAVVRGRHFPSVILSLVKSGSTQPFLTYEFDDVLISSISDSGSDEVPTESVSFSMVKVIITYYYQNPDGSITPIVFNSAP